MLSDEEWQQYRKDLDEIRANTDQISDLVPLIFQTPAKIAERELTLDRLRREQHAPLDRVMRRLAQAAGGDLAELYRIAGERLYR
jgi:hypothetical protein